MNSSLFLHFRRYSSIIFLLTTLPRLLFAQNEIKLNLRWNSNKNLYDIYGKPNFTAQNYPIGSTQISIVCPNIVPNNNLTTFSYQIGFSQLNSIYEPLAAAKSDFFAFLSLGAKLNLEENKEILLFSFRFSDNLCRDGIRIFNNSSDPGSDVPSMLGADFRNSITGFNGLTIAELYSSNYDNFGSICDNCPKLICIPFSISKNHNKNK